MKSKVNVSDICSIIETHAPIAYAEEWDNPGLQVGDYNKPVSKILISLDFAEDVLQEALDIKADMIVSHHPFLFRAVKQITTGSKNTELIMRTIQNNISIYAAHTNLDNINGGLNWIVADKLNLSGIEPLEPTYTETYKLITFVPTEHLHTVRQALFDAGAGTIGNYDCCSYSSEGYGTFKGNDATNPFVGNKGELHTEPELRLEVIVPYHALNKTIQALHKNHPYEEPAYDIITLKNKHKLIGSGINTR